MCEISQEREKILRKQRASTYSSRAAGFMLRLRDFTESLIERVRMSDSAPADAFI